MTETTLRDAAKLLYKCFFTILPYAKKYLKQYENWALCIPNVELRTQALNSMNSKKFHADGGSLYALLSLHAVEPLVRFIVAFQTISDYLDNLCDRSTSLDPVDFAQLHQSMIDAVDPLADPFQTNYYQYREDQDDGGYLRRLVGECQAVLAELPSFHLVWNYVDQWVRLYGELQTHKHVVIQERESRLIAWWQKNEMLAPELYWWEYAAATGSTLGVFVLCSMAANPELKVDHIEKIAASYFPWMGGVHIILDYLIDQEEDRVSGDLNFVSYYEHEEQTKERIQWMINRTLLSLQNVPNRNFHQLIVQGLLGLYLSDPKVMALPVAQQVRHIYKKTSSVTRFFDIGSRIYRIVRP